MKSCKELFANIALGTASMSKGMQKKGKFSQFISSGFWGTYYLFSKKRRMEQADLFFSKPDLKTTLEIFNFLEKPFIKNIMKVALPSIKVVKKIYIPMMDEVLTTRNLDALSQAFLKNQGKKENNRIAIGSLRA